MSLAPNLSEPPAFTANRRRDSLSWDLLEAVALSDGAVSGMRRVLDRAQRETGAAGVEWWGPGEDGAFTRIVTSGSACGEAASVALGRAGVLVIHGGRRSAALDTALEEVAPVIRRRLNEEQLARAAARLAQRNEALDEFAALVAHELKTPLQDALLVEEPRAYISRALDLVGVLLAAAQSGAVSEASSDISSCLDRAVGSLGRDLRVTSDVAVPVPLPPGPLFVILRNLLSNASSSGATSVHVQSERTLSCSRLLVEDDGAGLGARDRYATGSSLGLPLCRQIAARSGGVLELSSRAPSGSRATLTFASAGA
jgi:signal transduction histidine kinase